MPEDASSDEFKVAYAEALGGAIVARKEGRDRPKEGTLGTLILSYQKSLDYHDLRDTTKTGYQSWLNILTKQHGHRSVSGLTVERIEDKFSRHSRISLVNDWLSLKCFASSYSTPLRKNGCWQIHPRGLNDQSPEAFVPGLRMR
jgi:hypothetical protein